MKALRTLTIALAAVCAFTATAQAGPVPAPALKLLTVAAPTHLPPMQSEVQRVTVEAEGGAFTLSQVTGEGEGTPVTREGHLTFKKETTEVTLVNGTFEVGQWVRGLGLASAGAAVVSCSPDCSTPGSMLTLSAPTGKQEKTNQKVTIITKELSGVTGDFLVGDELSGIFLQDGTFVTGVGAGTLSLSLPPNTASVMALSGTETTAPIPFNASGEGVQSALEGLPGLGPGSVTVTRGAGGDAEHPYFVTFDGPFANEDVKQLSVDSSGLSGAHPFAHVFTTVPGGNGTGEIVMLAANIGGQPTSGAVTAHLGPLPEGIVTTGPPEGEGWSCPGGAGESEVTCTTADPPLRSLHSSPFPIHVPIEVRSNAPASASVPSELSGGGSLQPATYPAQIVVSNEPAPFGVAAIWAGSFEADGSPSTQAGGHPFVGAAYFMVNTMRTASGVLTPTGDSRDVVVDLPPGFVGNPLATKRCPQSTLIEPAEGSSELCNSEMSVGNLDPFIGSFNESLKFESHLYNDVPPKGYAAAFTTRLVVPLQSVLATVNSEEDFGIRLTAPNNANYQKIYGAFTAFEGVPKLGNGQALLTNPVNCAESAQHPPLVVGKADTYQNPGHYSETVIVSQPSLEGCENLRFEGEDPKTGEGQVGFSFRPTDSQGAQVTRGSSPVGATAHLHIDQGGLTDPNGLVTPELKRSVIKLPVGLSLNPSQANGLEACSEAQIGFRGEDFPMPNPMRFTEAQPTCPDASKLGTAEVETPILENPLVGTVYLAAEHENPFGSLLAIYLVVNDPLTGVIIKLPGEVQADPQTGQLTTTFDNSPQLPFEDLTLRFRGGGPRSEFATPEVCGHYETTGSWTPWSAPESGPPAQTSDSFDVTSGCSASAGARPFNPTFEAGTTNPLAGAYSPLVIKLSRNDGEQELKKLDFTLPQGLLGKLAGIGYCPDSAIATAKAKSGKAELSSASCPQDSHLGSIDASAGVGSEPIHVGGEIYLAGPYEGAPLSAVVIVPAVAGPIDLGNVVLKSPLRVDPATAKITATSGQIPTILEGIPAKLRSVTVKIDRPDFTFNPTSCEAMGITGTAEGSSGASSGLQNRFQVGGCKDLAFKPKLFTRLYGPTRRGGFPRFRGIVTAQKGEANTKELVVTLPHSEFLEQGHIRTICTRVQFAAHECPKGAIYGHVKVETPLLDYTLEGPAYLRSSNHKLPDLVLALHGPPSQPIEVELDGRIDSTKKGIRTSFESVPDAPFTKAILMMQGGKKGLLVNSRNICAPHKGRANVLAEGHTGAGSHTRPLLKNGRCGKGRKAKKSSQGHKRRGEGSRRG